MVQCLMELSYKNSALFFGFIEERGTVVLRQ